MLLAPDHWLFRCLLALPEQTRMHRFVATARADHLLVALGVIGAALVAQLPTLRGIRRINIATNVRERGADDDLMDPSGGDFGPFSTVDRRTHDRC